MPEPEDEESRHSWFYRQMMKIGHGCTPIIGEIKRAPPRPLRGAEFFDELNSRLEAAETDLVWYLAVHYERDPHAQSVIAYSASGSWWRWAQFSRAEVPPFKLAYLLDQGLHDDDDLAEYNKYYRAIRAKFAASRVFYLGTKESDEEWNRLRRDALIPILEAPWHDNPDASAPHQPAQPEPTQPPLPPQSTSQEQPQAGPSRSNPRAAAEPSTRTRPKAKGGSAVSKPQPARGGRSTKRKPKNDG